MSNHPNYPDSDDHREIGHDQRAPSSSRRKYVSVVLGGLLVLGFMLLHLTGVLGPGAR